MSGGGSGEHWHPGVIKPVMDADELRDALRGVGCMASRAPVPHPPRPEDQPDSLLALNAATAVRELVDDWSAAATLDGQDAGGRPRSPGA